MATVVVTGANRGLGLGLARAYAHRGDVVIAGVRVPGEAHDLNDAVAPHGVVLPLDVGDADSVSAFARALAAVTYTVDLLVNNAGMGTGLAAEEGPLSELRVDALEAVVRVNAIGQVLVTQAVAPLLAPAARVASVTSALGSIAGAEEMRSFGYSMSKAALNMAMRRIAFDPALRGRAVIVVHPGSVQTDMGGPHASISVEESVAGMVSVIDRLTPDDTGRFWNYTGDELPW